MPVGTVLLGDCLDHLHAIDAGSVDLVYLDPPYNTGSTRVGRDRGAGVASYDDSWSSVDAYVDFLRPRLAAIHRTLRPTGSVLVHVDWRVSHHVRFLLDECFGPEHFVNHLVWHYGLGGSSPRRFARKHDDILFYGRTDEYWFEPPRIPATSNRMRGRTKKATDVLDVPAINNMAAERTGYPTQKPIALLRLLIDACCPPGGLVVDPFCGSGTTVTAAVASGRRAIGIDVLPEATALTQARLAAALCDSTESLSGAH